MYSVLILTHNEEKNILDCIRSIRSDDIWVLDSGSDDETVALAKMLGANVRHRCFDNYANQRNYGFSLPFKYEWILALDADERLPDVDKNKMSVFLSKQNSDVSMITVRRRDYLWGRWLRGASGYPVQFPRIFRRGKISVKRSINEVYECDGKVLNTRLYLEHYPFSKGIDAWIAKHNRYSTMEVNALKCTSTDYNLDNYSKTRQKLKSIFYKLPGRPLIIFMYLYLYKLGILAGWPGLCFCILRSYYEFMIIIKHYDQKHDSTSSSS